MKTDRDHIWNQYTLRVPGPDRRDGLRRQLTAAGIGHEVYYPIPMHRQECFSYCVNSARDACPVATQLAAEALSIPIYPELSKGQLDAVVAAVTNALNLA